MVYQVRPDPTELTVDGASVFYCEAPDRQTADPDLLLSGVCSCPVDEYYGGAWHVSPYMSEEPEPGPSGPAPDPMFLYGRTAAVAVQRYVTGLTDEGNPLGSGAPDGYDRTAAGFPVGIACMCVYPVDYFESIPWLRGQTLMSTERQLQAGPGEPTADLLCITQ